MKNLDCLGDVSFPTNKSNDYFFFLEYREFILHDINKGLQL